MTTTTTLTFADVEAADLPDWRWLLGALHAHFATGDFATGLALVNGSGPWPRRPTITRTSSSSTRTSG